MAYFSNLSSSTFLIEDPEFLFFFVREGKRHWIPAYAGMTVRGSVLAIFIPMGKDMMAGRVTKRIIEMHSFFDKTRKP